LPALLFTRNKPTGFIRTNLNPNDHPQKVQAHPKMGLRVFFALTNVAGGYFVCA
jgi:hypothetical protein